MEPVREPLFTSAYGRVGYCRSSSQFDLDFGGMRLWLCPERLRQVARRLNEQVKALRSQAADSQIDVHLSGYYGDTLCLYPDELLDLQTLLNGSLVMVDLYQFLDEHQFLLNTNPLY